jgi:hypothetical protein
VRHHGGEADAVLGAADGVAGVGAVDVVAVHEVDVGAGFHLGQQRVRRVVLDGVPAHVRHLDPLAGREMADLRIDPAEPLVFAVLVGPAADQLHAQADAEQRLAGCHMGVEGRNHAGAAQVLHGFLEGADAGDDDAVTGGHRFGRADQLGLLADLGEGIEHRAQVAHAVVDDADG